MSEPELTSPVLEFYAGAKILVTGGTGFLGKSLIDKLLRVCTKVDRIYVIIREKKGKDPETRLKETFEDMIFNTLRKAQPEFEKKITCVAGDISRPNLGMSDEVYELLTREVTHVMHSAATVRFKEKLKTAIQINVLGLREIVNFCNKCTQLKILAYMSTAFCYYHGILVKEEFRDPPLLEENSLALVNALSDDQIDDITPSLIKPWPNTYVFSKAIAEDIISKLVCNYPVVVVRPSIVMGSCQEPVPGWIDNINGPTGIIAAVGSGIMRVLRVNDSVEANLVPVDMVINALLCSAWEVASQVDQNLNDRNSTDVVDGSKEASGTVATRQGSPSSPSGQPCHPYPTPKRTFIRKNKKIYNFVSRVENSVTWGEFLKLNVRHGFKYPPDQFLWYYTITLVKMKFLFNLVTALYHILPGLIVDAVLILSGKKPKLIKAYKKIYALSEALSYFTLYNWQFVDDNTRNLWNNLTETDRELFHFNMSELDWERYLENIVRGIRRFIFKQNESTLPQARRKLFFFWLAHRVLQLSFAALVFWLTNKYLLFKVGSYFYAPMDDSIASSKLIENAS